MAERSARARGTPAARSSDDEWQAHVTREAAREIGRWLEARGRLHQPIAALSLAELESLASVAISRFVVLAAERMQDQPETSGDLIALLAPSGRAPSAAARIAASATPTRSASTSSPATASARLPASMPERRSHKGTTA